MKFKEMNYDQWRSFLNEFEIEEGYDYPSWFIVDDDMCITVSVLDGNAISTIFKNKYVTNNEDKFILWYDAISEKTMLGALSDYDSDDFDEILEELTDEAMSFLKTVV